MRIFVLGSYVKAHCLGVEQLPVLGQSVHAQTLWVEHGGKGLNLAVGMHRLGAQVDLLLAVGADASGLLHYLNDEGLATQWLVRAGEASGFGVGFVAAGGENFLAVYPGANALLDAGHVMQASAALAAADLVCAQFEIPDAPILAAFRLAHEQGINTLLNPSPWRVPDAELLALTDILIVNEAEAAMWLGLTDPAALSPADWVAGLPGWAKQRSTWQGELLVVTLAGRGCVAWYYDSVVYQPAYSVAAIDATGAGDAFSAGLAVALAQRQRISEALRLANACGAWVASKQGVLPILPTTAEITAFIASGAVLR